MEAANSRLGLSPYISSKRELSHDTIYYRNCLLIIALSLQSVFGMAFFNYQGDKFNVSPDVWIFVVLVVSLLLLTLSTMFANTVGQWWRDETRSRPRKGRERKGSVKEKWSLPTSHSISE